MANRSATPQQLTTTGTIQAVEWAPDGSKIGYEDGGALLETGRCLLSLPGAAWHATVGRTAINLGAVPVPFLGQSHRYWGWLASGGAPPPPCGSGAGR